MARLLLSAPDGEPAQPPAAYNAGLHTVGCACLYTCDDAYALPHAGGGKDLGPSEGSSKCRSIGLGTAW